VIVVAQDATGVRGFEHLNPAAAQRMTVPRADERIGSAIRRVAGHVACSL
jgi:hypothetical protein